MNCQNINPNAIRNIGNQYRYLFLGLIVYSNTTTKRAEKIIRIACCRVAKVNNKGMMLRYLSGDLIVKKRGINISSKTSKVSLLKLVKYSYRCKFIKKNIVAINAASVLESFLVRIKTRLPEIKNNKKPKVAIVWSVAGNTLKIKLKTKAVNGGTLTDGLSFGVKFVNKLEVKNLWLVDEEPPRLKFLAAWAILAESEKVRLLV